MIKYMNLNSFRGYLVKTLGELSTYHKVELGDQSTFILTPVEERGKTLNSADEYIQRGMLNPDNLEGRFFDLDLVIKILGCRLPLCPIWVKVSLQNPEDEALIIELQTSLRFRKPRLLQNQETGHPPFIAVFPSQNE